MTIQAVRNTTARWRDLDMRHHLHPFTDTRQLNEARSEEHTSELQSR